MSSAARIEDDADEAIHRMDTLPPPDGEDDAYSAATKVGSMSRGLVEALMARAQVEERNPTPPPISVARDVSIPKPARLPTIGTADVGGSRAANVRRTYEEVEEHNAFDPTALFGATEGDALACSSGTRSIIDELGHDATAQPARNNAAWTTAPTLLAMSVAPLPSTTALAPLLEPPSRRGVQHRNTFGIEVAIFLGTFVLLAVPAALAYLHWMR